MVYYEDDIIKIEKMKDVLHFTCNILDHKYKYKLLAYPYVSTLEFRNFDRNKCFTIVDSHCFPNSDVSSEEWKQFGYKCYREVVTFLINHESEYKVRNQLRALIYEYSWNDIKDRIIDTIGAYWQNGIATGTVDSQLMYFAYTCSCNRNDDFFMIYNISEKAYNHLKETYAEQLNGASISNDMANEVSKFIEKYGTIIYEGWYI